MIVRDKPIYTPVKVVVKEKKISKMKILYMIVKDPLVVISAGWVGVTLSDIDLLFKITASAVVIVAGIYNLYKSMKKNRDI
jgi:hypothetical protein